MRTVRFIAPERGQRMLVILHYCRCSALERTRIPMESAQIPSFLLILCNLSAVAPQAQILPSACALTPRCLWHMAQVPSLYNGVYVWTTLCKGCCANPSVSERVEPFQDIQQSVVDVDHLAKVCVGPGGGGGGICERVRV